MKELFCISKEDDCVFQIMDIEDCMDVGELVELVDGVCDKKEYESVEEVCEVFLGWNREEMEKINKKYNKEYDEEYDGWVIGIRNLMEEYKNKSYKVKVFESMDLCVIEIDVG